MKPLAPILSPDGLRTALRAFCERHPIRRLDVFGSAASGQAGPRSDVDLLVTLDDSVPVSTLEILEMAGEAEELVGVPVDFVLRQALDRSSNGSARQHILATAVKLYGR
ncbi:MAG: nucleotidyltransferase domain-containing protein [Acidobacteria bacterium]|nr:nucleotidyltransferase domain-containing protein [Acidobacteriota bacterium]